MFGRTVLCSTAIVMIACGGGNADTATVHEGGIAEGSLSTIPLPTVPISLASAAGRTPPNISETDPRRFAFGFEASPNGMQFLKANSEREAIGEEYVRHRSGDCEPDRRASNVGWRKPPGTPQANTHRAPRESCEAESFRNAVGNA